MKNLIIIGAGGNGMVVASNIAQINKISPTIKVLGFLDDKKKKINGYKILGKVNLKNVKKYIKEKNTFFFWSLISTKIKKKAASRIKELKIPNSKFLNIIHPTANISENVKIGHGVNISSFVNISPNVVIKNHVNLFSQCMVGHDTKVESFCYLANNSVLGANILLQKGAYIGMNATVRENVKIGQWSTVGMGSVVLKDVDSQATVAGNPSRKMNK